MEYKLSVDRICILSIMYILNVFQEEAVAATKP